MKIFILIVLLLLGQMTEQHYAERFYTATSYLSYQIRLANKAKDKPAILKQLDHFLTKVDSTVTEIKDFQRKCFSIKDHCLQLFKKHYPASQHCVLTNCLAFFTVQSVERFLQRANNHERPLDNLKIFRQIKSI